MIARPQLKTRKQINTGQRMHVPAWLGNPDMAAPCICGMPLLPGATSPRWRGRDRHEALVPHVMLEHDE